MSQLKPVGDFLKTRDFFGIKNITTKDICGSISKLKLNHEEIRGKYLPLVKPRNALANEVKEKNVFFGTIRLDADNKPKFHGQFEPKSNKPMFDTIDIKQQFVKDTDIEPVSKADLEIELYKEPTSIYPDGLKVVDVEPDISLTNILKSFKREQTLDHVGKYDNKPPLVFQFETSTLEETGLKLSGHRLSESEIEESIIEAISKKDPEKILDYKPELDKTPLHELDPNSDEYYQRSRESLKDLEFDKSLDDKYDQVEKKRPTKALDYLKAVRAQRVEPTAKGLKHRLKTDNPYMLGMKVRLDSQGYNDYTYQVPDWSKLRHVELLDYLKKSIIYHNYDILAVNKPYGIASHNEQIKKDGDRALDMNKLMHEIAAEMKIEKLYLAHRLDKTTTGVLLFATSQTRANQLNKQFKSDQIKKTYWCIVNGVPEPPEGIIDIPICEQFIAGKQRACIAPERVPGEYQLSKKYVMARRAITEYRIVKSSRCAALLEVKPRTGVKHQIRCHMAFALNRPILGDHKYSHIDRLAPQKLTRGLLTAFRLRPQKVRTLPTHLHAKTVVIPGAKANGETLFITAPLAQHFKANLKKLGLDSEA